MARRRKKNNPLILALIGVGALMILTNIAIANPWSPISILFILLLICAAAFWLFNLVGKFNIYLKQEKRFRQLPKLYSASQISFLTPTDFEYYVATLFKGLGYAVEVTKQVGDEGIDIILKKDGKNLGVQVKKYSKGTIGRPEIQKLVGACLNKFDEMVFVTTSGYSHEAFQYAAQHRVKLIDGEGVMSMAEKVHGKDFVHKALNFSVLERK